MLRTKGLAPALQMILEHLRKLKPAFVVIDSFKAFDELSPTPGRTCASSLMKWRST